MLDIAPGGVCYGRVVERSLGGMDSLVGYAPCGGFVRVSPDEGRPCGSVYGRLRMNGLVRAELEAYRQGEDGYNDRGDHQG